MNLDEFEIPCAGNVVTGDFILFEESINNRAKFVGNRLIAAEVLNDYYEKDYHVFVLKVLYSEGTQPLEKNSEITRKAGLVYRRGVMRKAWEGEEKRPLKYDDKCGKKIKGPKPKFLVPKTSS